MKAATDTTVLSNLAEIGRFLDDRKGDDILILDLRRVNSYLSFFVIVTGNSSTHCRGMARDFVSFAAEKGLQLAAKPHLDSTWIVIDLGDIVIHIFNRETRSFYQLETLWGDGLVIDRLALKGSLQG